ncbi:MAG: hypothetical protein WCF84_26045 [Anaerolineae bacterium]
MENLDPNPARPRLASAGFIAFVLLILCGIGLYIVALLGPSVSAPQALRIPHSTGTGISTTPTHPIQTVIATKTCTLEGCSNTLSVKLTGKVPDDFVLEATSSDGQTRRVQCINGANESAQDRKTAACQAARVLFWNWHPTEVILTLSWAGNGASQTFQPTYRSSNPNGPDCEPTCYTSTVEFAIPEGQ